jgi:hypothetical protein
MFSPIVLLARQEHLIELDCANNDVGMAAILCGRYPRREKRQAKVAARPGNEAFLGLVTSRSLPYNLHSHLIYNEFHK